MTRERADLAHQLREQLGFISVSCRLYDEGVIAESKRVATSLRTLLYDDGTSSYSLLGQLGMLGLAFVNTNDPLDLKNLATHHGQVIVRVVARATEKSIEFAVAFRRSQTSLRQLAL